MIIYSESGEIIETPDLVNGWVEIKTSDTIKEHHPAIPMESHIEERDGKRIRVIDQHPRAAWKEYEEYGIYHPYEFSDQPSEEERITALENAMIAMMDGVANA